MKISKEIDVVIMSQKEVEYKRASLLGMSWRVKKNEHRITDDLVIYSNNVQINNVIVDGVVYTRA